MLWPIATIRISWSTFSRPLRRNRLKPEPAIFGVNLKYVFPFVCAMAGSACAGFLSCLFSCTANAIGVGGLPGILAMQPQSMLMYALCMLVAIVVPFVLTYIVGKRKGIDKQAQAVAASLK